MPSATLTTPQGTVTLGPDTATLSLQVGRAHLRGQVKAAVDHAAGKPVVLTGLRVTDAQVEPVHDAHGAGQMIRAVAATDSPDFMLCLEVATYESHPFVALRVGLTNRSASSVHIQSLTAFASTELELSTGPLDGWVNGYHSWCYTGFVPHDKVQPRPAFGYFTWPFAFNTGTPHPRRPGRYTGEWLAALISPEHKQAIIGGLIGVERMFGQVYLDGRPGQHALRLQNSADDVPLEPNDTIWGEWAILYAIDLPHPDPLAAYAEAVTRLTPGRAPAQSPAPGWSSWYQFFADVTLDDMQRNQAALVQLRNRLPLNLIQLDDGYQQAWGDWLRPNEKFAGGIDAWAAEVRQAGFDPGLWLSPFTLTADSTLWTEHPEIVLRDAGGQPVNGGRIFTRQLYGIDPTHPATVDFIAEVFDTIVHRWGIPYLKLDFLFTGALPARRYDSSRTRAQALRDGLTKIRHIVGEDVSILGCGCPLGPALGLVDVMRISADVAPYWYPEVFGINRLSRSDYSLPAARNSLSETLQRHWTHRRWWWLDGDNLLVRRDQKLEAAEVQTLTSVLGLTESHLIVSDDLPQTDRERLAWAARLLPNLPGDLSLPTSMDEQHPRLLVKRFEGAAGRRTVIALINWQEKPASVAIPRALANLPLDLPLIAVDFWHGTCLTFTDDPIRVEAVPAHGVVQVSLQPEPSGPALLGTDLHISMGAEVTRWQASDSVLRFTVELGRQASGNIWVWLPFAPNTCRIDHQPADLEPAGPQGAYRLPVQIDGQAVIEITV